MMARRFLSSPVALAAATLSLSACAGGPVAAPPIAAPAPAPAAASAPAVTMSPIPNPTAPRESDKERVREREASKSEPSPEPSSHAAKPVAPARAPPPAVPVVDPVKAARLRERGLEQLNRGSIRNAVQLLTQASRLDPDNPLIRRDLERALRISRAVGGKP
jgi:hypothetical protein